MHVSKVTYSISAETVNIHYLKKWERVEVAVTLDNGDSADYAYRVAKEFAHEKLKATIKAQELSTEELPIRDIKNY